MGEQLIVFGALCAAGLLFWIGGLLAKERAQNLAAEKEPAETAKQWVERVHGIKFDAERRKRSGLPPIPPRPRRPDHSLDRLNNMVAPYGIRFETEEDMSEEEINEYLRRAEDDRT